MVTTQWADLEKLAEIAFEVQMQKLKKLSAAEAKLIAQRQHLAAMNKDALREFSSVHPAHWQNGDFLWQSWIGENIEALGREQARVRALSEMHKPELRKAFGRKAVLARLAAN